MLKLRFASAGDRDAEPPASDGPGVQTWRNHRGGVVARGFARDGCRWMYCPYLANFRFDLLDGFVTAFPARNAPVDIVWDTYRRSVLPMALQAAGFEALHASAVVSNGRVVAFSAVSETGKSTIAYGLHRRGYPQWSDDAVVFQTRRGVTAVPLPFDIRLRDESTTLFDPPAPAAQRFEGNVAGSQIHTEPAGVAAVCLLTRSSGPSVAPYAELRRMSASEAFPPLLRQAHVFDPSDADRRETMLRAYLDLVEIVPVYEVAFAAGRDRLNSVLDTIAARVLTPSDQTTARAS